MLCVSAEDPVGVQQRLPKECRGFLQTKRTRLLRVWGQYGKRHWYGGDAQAVSDIAVSADGRTAITTDGDGSAKLWDISTGKELKTFHAGRMALRMACLPEGKEFLMSLISGPTRWGTVSEQAEQTFGWGSVYGLALSPDGRSAFGQRVYSTSSHENRWEAALVDLKTGTRRWQRPMTRDTYIQAAKFLPDGQRVVVGFDGEIQVWEFDAEDPFKHTVLWHPRGSDWEHKIGSVSPLFVTSDGKRVVFGGFIGAVGSIEVSTAKELWMRDDSVGAMFIAVAPNESVALIGHHDGLARLIDLTDGTELDQIDLGSRSHERIPRLATDYPTAAVFPPDGQSVLVGTARGVVLHFHIDFDTLKAHAVLR